MQTPAALPPGTSQRDVPAFRVRPDFVFRQARLAVFVDGCFWHGCPRHATKPKNNFDFWHRKLSGNKQRDRLVNRTLRSAHWRVLRIWECDLQRRPEACVARVMQALAPPGTERKRKMGDEDIATVARSVSE